MASHESTISVAVRVRPFTNNESAHLTPVNEQTCFLGDGSFSNTSSSNLKLQAKGIRKLIEVVDDKMLIFDPPDNNPMVRMQKVVLPSSSKRPREYRFVFDRLFDEDATQDDVFANTTRPLLDSILDGYNATVFAYGATGCGKTHTVTGSPDNPGIIPLTMKELFQRIDKEAGNKIIEVSLSYLEIYNETIRDLLQPSSKNLVLREDEHKKISVSNLSVHKPVSVEQVLEMIIKGNHNRTMSPTEANATSSRSHAVLQINVIQKDRTAAVSEAHTFATLSIIDLAGSERASATKNRGERLIEGANINKSLLALGNCINALCDPRRRNHVPYRDSKLTRLLKFSLGGNCKTVMIVCISPSSQHYDETLNTLKYADRAKKIKTKISRNEQNLDRHVGSYLKMITELRMEITELKAKEKRVGEQTEVAMRNKFNLKQRALYSAVESLKEEYDKIAPLREQKVLQLKRDHKLNMQLMQVQLWIEQFNDIFNKKYELRKIPELENCLLTANETQNKLLKEREVLNYHLNTLSADVKSFEHSVRTIKTRLIEVSQCTENEIKEFTWYADYLKELSERQNLENSKPDNALPNSISLLNNALFEFIAKFQLLSFVDQSLIFEELQSSAKDLLDVCTSAFNTILSANSFEEDNIDVLTKKIQVPSPSKSKMFFNSPKKIRNISINPRTNSPMFKSLKRVSSRRHTVIIRSPRKERKKSLKRVRWEDQSSPVEKSLIQDFENLSQGDLSNAIPIYGDKEKSDSPNTKKDLENDQSDSDEILPPPLLESEGFKTREQHKENISIDPNDKNVMQNYADNSSDSINSDTSNSFNGSLSLSQDDIGINKSPASKRPRFGARGELKKWRSKSLLSNTTTDSYKPKKRFSNVSELRSRVEKENIAKVSPPLHRRASSITAGSVPKRLTVPTAASSMKQIDLSSLKLEQEKPSKSTPWR